MRPTLSVMSIRCAVLASIAACGDDTGPSASCGDETKTYDCASSIVSYTNTVAPLSSMYCTECHSSTKTGTQRQGAPTDHDYDTEEGWIESGAHGLGEIQCGRMPYLRDPVPQEMVDKLDEWVTCKGLKSEHDHGDHEHE